MAAAGEQAEAAKEETMKKYKGEYLLMIEGSIPTKDEGYCCVGGKAPCKSPARLPKAPKPSSPGKLRMCRLRAGGQPEPDRRKSDP